MNFVIYLLCFYGKNTHLEELKHDWYWFFEESETLISDLEEHKKNNNISYMFYTLGGLQNLFIKELFFNGSLTEEIANSLEKRPVKMFRSYLKAFREVFERLKEKNQSDRCFGNYSKNNMILYLKLMEEVNNESYTIFFSKITLIGFFGFWLGFFSMKGNK